MSDSADGTAEPRATPLLRRDPPALGAVTLTGRLFAAHDAGLVYAGELDGREVTVVMLSAGAAADSYARARFRDAAAALTEADAHAVVAREDDEEVAPWVALDAPSTVAGRSLSRQLLAAVTLEDRSPVGVVHGPSYRPHWWQRVGVGRWRLWPLPWPATLVSAGRWTFIASFTLACAIAALALWLTVQVFQNQPPPPPGPGPGPGPVPPPTFTPTPSPTGPVPTGPQGTAPGQPLPPIV